MHVYNVLSLWQSPCRANAWAVAVGTTTPLLKKHFVCQLHFREDDVVTNFSHTLPHGDVVSFERDRYMLRKGTIPVTREILQESQLAECVKPSAHDASFLAGSLAGRFYAGCAAFSQAGRNVGLASYGAGCRAGLQARCCSFVAHERAQAMHSKKNGRYCT